MYPSADPPQALYIKKQGSLMNDSDPDHEHGGDCDSVKSYGSTVSNMSANWAGKSTKYVPHCQKRHMEKNDVEYLTPTQRKNRLIADLKKQLRHSNQLLEEKDRHIATLREKLSEIETVLDSGGYLSENHRLLTKLRQLQESSKREKEALIAKHENRIRRLRKYIIPETDLTPEGIAFSAERSALLEGSPAPGAGSDLDSGVTSDPDFEAEQPQHPEERSTGIQTDTDPSITEIAADRDRIAGQLQGAQFEVLSLKHRVTELESSLLRVHELESEMPYHSSTVLSSSQECTFCKELATQIEALKNENLIWRTKSSEMELEKKQIEEALKLNLESVQQAYAQISAQYQSIVQSLSGECMRPECVTRKDEIADLEAVVAELKNKGGRLSTQFLQRQTSLCSRGGVGGDGSSSIVADSFREENEELFAEKEQLASQLEEIQKRLDIKSSELSTALIEVNKLKEARDIKQTELEVSELTLERMREEILNLQGKVADKDTLINRLEQAGIPVEVGNNGSGITATPAVIRRKRGGHQVETVNKMFQTDLAMDQIEAWVHELEDLRVRHAELCETQEETINNLKFQIGELMQNLQVKNGLAESLTNQLSVLQDTFEEARQIWLSEKEELSLRIDDLAPVAAKVPRLEANLEHLEQEGIKERAQFRAQREEFEKALDEAATGALKIGKTSEDYWGRKVEDLKKKLEETEKRLTETKAELNSFKIKLNLEKTELQHQLTMRIHEVRVLHERVNKDKMAKLVQTDRPANHKAVAARPRVLLKGTQVLEGELYDEKAENIKLLEGELETSQKMIDKLKHKLYDSANLATRETQEQNHYLMELVESYAQELENLKLGRISELHEKTQLEGQMECVSKENMSLKRQRRDDLQKLETEFGLVQHELQVVVERYENQLSDLKVKLQDNTAKVEFLSWKRNVLKEELISLIHDRDRSIDLSELTERLRERSPPIASGGMEDSGISYRSTESPVKTGGGSGPAMARLAKENGALKDDLNSLKEKLDTLVEESQSLGSETDSNETALEPPLVGKLRAVRQDLVNVLKRREDTPEMEAKLDQWLRVDIQSEKLGLETICQWYDKDKLELKAEVKKLKDAAEAALKKQLEAENNLGDIQSELATLRALHREAVNELEIYKMEKGSEGASPGLGMVTGSQSEGALAEKRGRETRVGSGHSRVENGGPGMLREVVQLQEKFRAAKYEKAELEGNLKELRGELAVIHSEYETERDRLLAKIEEATGERWDDAAQSVNYVRELQRNLEIKKQELYDLSEKHEKNIRELREQLFVERAKNSQKAPEKQDMEVLQEAHKKLSEKAKSWSEKCKVSGKLLAEREKMLKILERELQAAEHTLEAQNGKFDTELAALNKELERIKVEKEELMKAATQTQSEKVALIEKLWKTELETLERKYATDTKSLKRELLLERHRAENYQKTGSQKLRAVSNILNEKEKVIRILEKELRVVENSGRNVETPVLDAAAPFGSDLIESTGQLENEVSVDWLGLEAQSDDRRSRSPNGLECGVPRLCVDAYESSAEGTSKPTDSSGHSDDLPPEDRSPDLSRDLRETFSGSSVTISSYVTATEGSAEPPDLPRVHKGTSPIKHFPPTDPEGPDPTLMLESGVGEEMAEIDHLEVGVETDEHFACQEKPKGVSRPTSPMVAWPGHVEQIAGPSELEETRAEKESLKERVEELNKELETREEKHKQTYMLMFQKGQDVAKAELMEEVASRHRQTSGSSSGPDPNWDFHEELAKLHREIGPKPPIDLSTEEVILRFLRDAVYYFLLGKSDSKNHLHAIMDILKFSQKQKDEISKVKGLPHT